MKKEFSTYLEEASLSLDGVEQLFLYHLEKVAQGDLSILNSEKERLLSSLQSWKSKSPIIERYEFAILGISAYFQSNGELAGQFLGKCIPPQYNWENKDIEGALEGMYAGNCRSKGQFDEAIYHLNRSIKISSTEGPTVQMLVMHYYQLGEVYRILGEYNQAIHYFNEAINTIAKSGANLYRIYSGLGNLYLGNKEYDDAIKNLELAVECAESGSQEGRSLFDLGQYYQKIGQYDKALDYTKRSLKVREEYKLFDAANSCLILEGKILLKTGETDKSIEVLEDALQKSVEYTASVKIKEIYGLLSRAYEQKQDYKSAYLNFQQFEKMQSDIYSNQQKEIFKLKNKEITEQKKLLEVVHREITDSINYAERIQRSFLASEDVLSESLGEHFIYFNPKEAVSGDFYWAGNLDNGNFAVCCADSTGHGVPGAIMSILNISSIERAVENKASKPAEIFNQARKLIIDRLKKDGSEKGGKDGMDASLISFNKEKTVMQYVAAHNPIWIIRAGELIDIKAEKMPVGKHDHDHISFAGGEFEIQKGDVIYILTDGYQDQFGGEKGKKFKVKPFKRLLIDNAHSTMSEQHQKISDTFDKWKGDLEQVDDVCVIGVKV